MYSTATNGATSLAQRNNKKQNTVERKHIERINPSNCCK